MNQAHIDFTNYDTCFELINKHVYLKQKTYYEYKVDLNDRKGGN